MIIPIVFVGLFLWCLLAGILMLSVRAICGFWSPFGNSMWTVLNAVLFTFLCNGLVMYICSVDQHTPGPFVTIILFAMPILSAWPVYAIMITTPEKLPIGRWRALRVVLLQYGLVLIPFIALLPTCM